jgi:hypothetical protein
VRVVIVEPVRLCLCDPPVSCGDRGGPQTLAAEHDRIVQIDELRGILEFEIGHRQRQASRPHQGLNNERIASTTTSTGSGPDPAGGCAQVLIIVTRGRRAARTSHTTPARSPEAPA